MRLTRTLCTCIFIMMLGAILVTGCNSARVTTINVQTPRPFLQLAASAWTANPLPVAGSALLSYVVSPIDSETVYACTGRYTITLWVTHNGGQHWSPISLPATPGISCSFSISVSQPQHIALLVNEVYDYQRPCDRDTLYLSTDSGKTWKHILHASIAPIGAKHGYCQITVTANHLYMWYSYGGGQNTPQLSLLESIDNAGANWSRADIAFGAGKIFLPPQVGEDGTLAISVRNALHAPGTKSVLWMSHDAGHSWQRMGVLPPQADLFLLTTPQQGASWPSSATPFYALAHEQLPSYLYSLQVFESTDGRQWFANPPLSVPYASITHPGLLQSLTVTDNGHLLAFGVNPRIGVSIGKGEQKPIGAFWLWSWNPQIARWQVLPSPLTHLAEEGCAFCWSGQFSRKLDHTSILSVYHWQDTDSFFSVKLPNLA